MCKSKWEDWLSSADGSLNDIRLAKVNVEKNSSQENSHKAQKLRRKAWTCNLRKINIRKKSRSSEVKIIKNLLRIPR